MMPPITFETRLPDSCPSIWCFEAKEIAASLWANLKTRTDIAVSGVSRISRRQVVADGIITSKTEGNRGSQASKQK
jgi:hypothetical protein